MKKFFLLGLFLPTIFHVQSVLAKESNSPEYYIHSSFKGLYLIGEIGFFNFLNNDVIQDLLQRFLKACLATLIFLLAFFVVKRLFRFIERKIKHLAKKAEYLGKIAAEKINYDRKDLIVADQVTNIVKTVVSWSKFIALSSILLIYLNFLLSLFPLTQSISSKVFESLSASITNIVESILNYIPKFITFVAISVITFYGLKFVRFVFKEIEKEHFSLSGFDPEWSAPTGRIVEFGVAMLYLMIAFPYLPGAGSDIFKGLTIFVGVLFSLGSSSAITNVIAGILLTYTRAFRIGDEVEIDGIAGNIIDKGLLTTRIINYSNRFVSIPNSKVLNSNVVNLRAKVNIKDEKYPAPAILIKIEIPHQNDWKVIYRILVEAALETNDVLKEPEPRVLHSKLDNSYTVYTLIFFTYKPTSGLVSSDVRCKIKEKLYSSGIKLEASQQILDLLRNYN